MLHKFKANKDVPKSAYGYDYTYKSGTDDEGQYLTRTNRKFYKMSNKEQKKHILMLWRKAFSRAMGCSAFINQYQSLSTKIAYFGR